MPETLIWYQLTWYVTVGITIYVLANYQVTLLKRPNLLCMQLVGDVEAESARG